MKSKSSILKLKRSFKIRKVQVSNENKKHFHSVNNAIGLLEKMMKEGEVYSKQNVHLKTLDESFLKMRFDLIKD